MKRITLTWLCVLGALGALCLTTCGRERGERGGERREAPAHPLFTLLSPQQTGITFANTITPTDSLDPLTDAYIYNGAGVGVGDIDNDGLPDIFFAGNMLSSRLYRNKGNLQFEDITQAAGVRTSCWATGVSMVDINHDGWLDIYVACSGPEWSTPAQRANLLFINHGNGTFTDEAARYGIADGGFTTTGVFLDYDGDGDLDLFLLNNSPRDFQRGQVASLPSGERGSTPDSYNELYRNNGNGTFTNVSDHAGILRDVGFGLGAAVGDINGDGAPDIYVSNDITPNDVLYINQRNGTFRDKARTSLKHTSFAGMGVDIADFNNDGRPDILQVDMMPADLAARKLMSLYLTTTDVLDLQRRGFRIDYEVNTLQLNNGVTQDGDPLFSEVARLAGLAYTDWSWAPLFADFDNDGLKDVFVTNGYPQPLNDIDYQVAAFAAQRAGNKQRQLQLLRELPGYSVANYLFRNNGDLTFSDRSSAWGMTQPGFSYGAAYVDLNNDGKLDLVVNNLDAVASIYENVGAGAGHYLTIHLQGESPNLRGVGTSLEIITGARHQYLYQTPYRGYMSSVDDRLHAGFGEATVVDSLIATWPDGRRQVLTNLPVDRTLTLAQRDAEPGTRRTTPFTRQQPFHPVPGNRVPRYLSMEASSTDFAVQPLLPDEPSRQGPPLAIADVNGDGLEDVFIGGIPGAPGRLFLQRKSGGFLESPLPQPWASEAFEDWGAQFFDANGDGRPDLYVASGGYQLSPVSGLLQDRLYINQGNGRFVRDSAALPVMLTSTAAVAVGDFNGDGRPDLFVGGRLVPRNYPYPARSYVLRNDGGRFTDVTDSVAPALARPHGMITAAVWLDFDGDGRLDLVTAGEWLPLEFFKNDGTHLRDVTASVGPGPTRGRWYSLAAGDFNHDGRPDLVAGNLGLNHTFTTSPDSTFGVYAESFTGNQKTDIIFTKRIAGRDYPIAGASAIGQAIYTVAVQFPTFRAFSTASIDQLFSRGQLDRALHYETDTFASLYLQNTGREGGGFSASPLPNPAQVSPIRGIVVHDVDGDGNLDLIVAGNLYGTEPNTPRADASNGLWLRGDGGGHFRPVPPVESGFLTPLDVTGLAQIQTPTGTAVLVVNHGDSLSAFAIRNRSR